MNRPTPDNRSRNVVVQVAYLGGKMAKRKFDKQASLEAGEVVLSPVEDFEVVAWTDDVQETETFMKREQEPEDEQLEATIPAEPASATCELTQADIKWAKAHLTGTPNIFDSFSKDTLRTLCYHGIAADFGADGFARGYKFFTV